MDNRQLSNPAVYGIIINKNNQVLLMKRQNTGFADGFYSIPGGKLDDLEAPSVAVVRELKEEINLDLNLQNLNCVMTQHRLSYGCACVDFYYLIENEDFSKIKINEPNKCAELLWCDIDNLPYELLEYIRNAITKYQEISFIEDHSSYLIDKDKAI